MLDEDDALTVLTYRAPRKDTYSPLYSIKRWLLAQFLATSRNDKAT